MRKTVILTASLMLGGCATTGGAGDKLKEIQEYTKLACAFVPTIATLTALANQGAGQSVSTIGNTICNAVTSIPLSQGGTRNVVVNGVKIRGEFTNGKKI